MKTGELVLDNSGNHGVVKKRFLHYALISWYYGQFSFNTQSIKRDRNGIFNLKER